MAFSVEPKLAFSTGPAVAISAGPEHRNSLLSFQSAICHGWLQILLTDQTKNTGGAVSADMNGWQVLKADIPEKAAPIVLE